MKSNTKATLLGLEGDLVSSCRYPMFGNAKWRVGLPLNAGVYGIWEISTGMLIYVGQTSSLHLRMGDISRSVNHTFRRKAAKKYGLTKLSDKSLSKRLSKLVEISFLKVELGRAELEEFMIIRWEENLLNKPGKRLLKSTQYDGVKKLSPTELNDILAKFRK